MNKNRSYRQIVAFVSETPWAMLPSKLVQICDLIAYKVDGGEFTQDEIMERIEADAYAAKGRPTAKKASGVAVIPVYGVISPKVDLMSSMSGGTSMDQLCAALNMAAADPNVGSIMLEFDTPGGAVPGVPEAAAAIRAARQKKPVVAMVNQMAASAGYWLAAQASEIVVSPSAEVGSIGVYAAHTDVSGAMDSEGVKTTLVSAGKYKTELSPFAPLSEEGRSAIQKNVNHYYAMFTADVAKGRGADVGGVRAGFGEGRMVTAREAVSEGMADKIDTFDSTLNRMMGVVTGHKSGRTQSAADLTQIYVLTSTTDTTNGSGTSVFLDGWSNALADGSVVSEMPVPVEDDDEVETDELETGVVELSADKDLGDGEREETSSEGDVTMSSIEEGPTKTLAELRRHAKETAINERRNYLDILGRLNQ